MLSNAIIGVINVNCTSVGENSEKESNYAADIGTIFSGDLKSNVIEVAILSGDKLIISRIAYFIEMLTDYEWIVGNTRYRFEVTLITDDDILKGNLKTEKYDLIVVPGGGVGDGECAIRCFPSIENKKWKKHFADFVKDGGGYYSVCGGTTLITDLDLERRPKSFLEYAYEKSSLGLSAVKSHYNSIANPLLCQIGGLSPEYVGANAYCTYSGFNLSDYDINYHTGVCLDCEIFHDNPIFDDYLEDIRKIRWIGGPSLVVPNDPGREVTVLARYPIEEISDNGSTMIHAWKYTGGIRGIFKGFIEHIKNRFTSASQTNLGGIYAFAGDWEPTDKIIQTDYSNRPAMTAEMYPNGNQARIVLSGLHPEDNVWWGGHIEETEDIDYNTLWDALYKWVNITSNSKALEWKYNYWINRRSVAWVSKKVPNNDLPPVYGPSEVSDVYPYSQSPKFTIAGNAETSDGSISLELYYRFSNDNLSWTNWTYYNTDPDGSDGWYWEFDATHAKGLGYYQFYSNRRVEFENYWETERTPSGPDAIANVSGWYQINEDGFGSRFNRAPRGIEVFNNSLIFGTANYNNDSKLVLGKSYSVYSFLKASINGSHSVNGLRSNGCEIWCYNDKNWKQLVGSNDEAIMEAGFGNKNNLEVGVLIKYNDYLYAGLRNQAEGAQIWRTKNINDKWELVVENGFGNKNNVAVWTADIFNGHLYVGTMNFGDGLELYRTTDGKDWDMVVGKTQSTKSGFGTKDNFYSWSMCVYKSCLYIGTDNTNGGGELWKSSDGSTWKPVIAYKNWISAKLHGADFPRGFSRGSINYRGGIRRMIVYNNELYLGLAGEDLCINFFIRDVGKIFGLRQAIPLLVHPIRRFTSMGCEIWKYNDTDGTWKRVVGGILKGNASGGFGDIKNEYIWSIETDDNYLYVGTIHPKSIDFIFNRSKFLSWYITVGVTKGKGELWRYDGNYWEQINEDGFGDVYNIGIREMKIYNGSLIAGTMNLNNGCEIWKYEI